MMYSKAPKAFQARTWALSSITGMSSEGDDLMIDSGFMRYIARALDISLHLWRLKLMVASSVVFQRTCR